MSAKDAFYSYLDKHAKQNKDSDKPRRKNKTPEADLQGEIILKGRRDDFKFYITDSSARWSNEAEAYISEKYESGMSDLTGDRDGLACYIEVKAPGRISTLKMHQREFLLKKIDRGCFACCVDSYELVLETWIKWRQKGNYKEVLKRALPKVSVCRDNDEPLF